MTAENEERLKVLQLLEDDKITAEEASALLRAMEGKRHAGPASTSYGYGAGNRFLRIRVTDALSGVEKVNVTVPVGLVNVALRMAERFAPDFGDFDLQELEALIASSTGGKLIEVRDEQGGEMVEIYVE